MVRYAQVILFMDLISLPATASSVSLSSLSPASAADPAVQKLVADLAATLAQNQRSRAGPPFLDEGPDDEPDWDLDFPDDPDHQYDGDDADTDWRGGGGRGKGAYNTRNHPPATGTRATTGELFTAAGVSLSLATTAAQ